MVREEKNDWGRNPRRGGIWAHPLGQTEYEQIETGQKDSSNSEDNQSKCTLGKRQSRKGQVFWENGQSRHASSTEDYECCTDREVRRYLGVMIEGLDMLLVCTLFWGEKEKLLNRVMYVSSLYITQGIEQLFNRWLQLLSLLSKVSKVWLMGSCLEEIPGYLPPSTIAIYFSISP